MSRSVAKLVQPKTNAGMNFDAPTPQVSERMRQVRREGTVPEMRVRRLLHSMGFRYRLHDPKLPGSPDIVFHGRRRVIFIHGCFWHRHNCSRATTPKVNTSYWTKKFQRNVSRDIANREELSTLGWQVLTVWECQTKNVRELKDQLTHFLNA